mmetsp:Transcript_14906/g.36025  ORF Transcript_14906/g.36025 Transcript_14906/m.36025 type:complete len:217 (+) Transcript_14906:993-1643(+)
MASSRRTSASNVRRSFAPSTRPKRCSTSSSRRSRRRPTARSTSRSTGRRSRSGNAARNAPPATLSTSLCSPTRGNAPTRTSCRRKRAGGGSRWRAKRRRAGGMLSRGSTCSCESPSMEGCSRARTGRCWKRNSCRVPDTPSPFRSTRRSSWRPHPASQTSRCMCARATTSASWRRSSRRCSCRSLRRGSTTVGTLLPSRTRGPSTQPRSRTAWQGA